MSTLEPRELPTNAYKGWLKNGGRIVLRSWDVWVPLMFIVSCLGNVLVVASPYGILLLGAISGVLHGLNSAAAERYSRRQRFGWMGLIACWFAEAKAFDPIFRRSLWVRASVVLALLVGTQLLNSLHPVAHAASPDDVKTMVTVLPFWLQFFRPWNDVWFFALMFQAGGPLSIHYLLMTRCGTTPLEASVLFRRAFMKNLRAMMNLLSISLVLMLVADILPFLTVPIDCFWTAVLFCAWNEMFMGKGALEKQEALATRSSLAPLAG